MFILEVSGECPSERYPIHGIFAFDQAKALAGYGHKVVFAALDVRSLRRWRRWGIYTGVKNGIPVYTFSFPIGAVRGLDNAARARGFKALLEKIVREQGRPDIIHAHFGEMAESIVGTCLRESIPYVVTEHSSLLTSGALPKRLAKKLAYTYSKAAAVIAVGRALRDSIRDCAGTEATVIPNVIDMSLFAPRRVKTGGDGETVFVSSGNLQYRKGFDILLAAFRQFCDRHPDSRLVIMGDGPERRALQDWIDAHALSGRVTLYGKYLRADFARELVKSDAFILASRNETFGVVCAEAMACGVPVIATRCGGPENFVDEACGLLVEVGDVEGLAEAMERIAARPEDFDRKAIAKRMREQFSEMAVAASVTGVFCSVLGLAKQA